MPPIISGIISLVSGIFGSISEEQKSKLALALQENQGITDLLKAQANIDANEAANPNLWVAGARPAVMWVCACSFAWQYLLQPIITYSVAMSGHVLPALPNFDSATMTTVLMGMLGLGAMRTFEKFNSVQGNH